MQPNMHIVADTQTCIGAGQCVLTAPDLFDQDDNGIVVVLVPQPVGTDVQDRARRAVQRCPSGAIAVIEL